MNIKNFIRMGMLCVAFAGMTLTSCSDDNNGDNGGQGSVDDVNPDKVFPAGVPSNVFGYTVNKDAMGRVTSIGRIATFDYSLSGTRAAEGDVLMTYNDGDRYNIWIDLNEKGFVRHAKAYEEGEPYMEWTISYDGRNQVSHVKFIDYDERNEADLNFKYSADGLDNYTGSGKFDGHKTTATATVVYTDSEHPNGVPNKDRYIMWYDGIGGFDFDVLQLAYYAGLLGVGPELLPLKLESEQKMGNETYKLVENYSWRLDSRGYPASVTTTYRDYYNDVLDESGKDNTSFSW